MRGNEVRCADGDAQGNQPPLGIGAVANPDGRAKRGNSRWRRARSAVVDARLAQVGRNAGMGFDGAGHEVEGSPRSGGCSHHAHIVQEGEECLTWEQRPGSCLEGPVLSQCKEGGGQRIPLFDPLSLVDLVEAAGLVIPVVHRGVAVEAAHEGQKWRSYIVHLCEDSRARHGVVGAAAVEAHERGGGI